MTFDPQERSVLAGLADVLIPAGDGFPAASEAGVAGVGLDQVLTFRPDLADGLKKLLTSARGRSPANAIEDFEKNDPASFGLLAELVPGAYFLNAEVLVRLGYQGQNARALVSQPDYLDDGLLQSVIERGPIYRPTPTRGIRAKGGELAAGQEETVD
jgi:hypothetical protein